MSSAESRGSSDPPQRPPPKDVHLQTPCLKRRGPFEQAFHRSQGKHSAVETEVLFLLSLSLSLSDSLSGTLDTRVQQFGGHACESGHGEL